MLISAILEVIKTWSAYPKHPNVRQMLSELLFSMKLVKG